VSDPFYRALEDELRGSRDTIRQRLKAYVPFLRGLRRHHVAGPVLDLGCGRGEWLELAQDHGFQPLGIDMDEGMLQACHDLGLSTLHGDALAHLKQAPDESQVLISAFHLVEHLNFEQLRSLVTEAQRVLKPGGLLIMETPNPENIQVGSANFYIDPTHERPIPSVFLSFLVGYCGFARNKVVRLQESPRLKRQTVPLLLDVLTGVSPDYAVVAQKKGPDALLRACDLAFNAEFGLTLLDVCGRYDLAFNAALVTLREQHDTLVRLEASVEESLAAATLAQERATRMEHAFQEINASLYRPLTSPLRWAGLQLRLLRVHGPLVRLKAMVRKLGTVDAAMSAASSTQPAPETEPPQHLLVADARTQPSGQRQLLLDVSVLAITDAKSGIQRVGRSILAELLNNPPADRQVRAIRYCDGRYLYADAFSATVSSNAPRGTDASIDLHRGDQYLALDLNMHIVAQTEPLFRDMAEKGVELFFTVYDVLPLQRPDWWHEEIAPMYRQWLSCLSRHASGLCCISAAVAQDVTAWLEQHPPERVRPGPAVCSFHLGADVQNSMPSRGLPDDAASTLVAIGNNHSFLMVSTLEPRKGHAQTLDAFDLLWAQGKDVTLVIAGRRGWLVDGLIRRIEQHPENGRRLLWLEGISDEYLEKVYAASTCLIAASEGEGFGLPLIEAAQHRLPIIARSLPVFKEVAGDFAFYFEGGSPEVLAQAIQQWLTSHATNTHPRSDTMPWLNWRQSTEQLLSTIQSIHNPQRQGDNGLMQPEIHSADT